MRTGSNIGVIIVLEVVIKALSFTIVTKSKGVLLSILIDISKGLAFIRFTVTVSINSLTRISIIANTTLLDIDTYSINVLSIVIIETCAMFAILLDRLGLNPDSNDVGVICWNVF